jgi:transcriptional regulator with GAF, ATPase, and Fis domain
MQETTDPAFDIALIRRLQLDMAEQRTVQAVLNLVVNRLVEQRQVALARIWLLKPGDICVRCPMRPECPDQTQCLHLVASAGRSLAEGDPPWTSIDGDFRRFPLGVRKVGRIAATAEPVEVLEIGRNDPWIARPEWVQQEQIRGLGGQPLVHRGEVLGVLAVFTRAPMIADNLFWLRTIADHSATAIANARAFEEIERLQRQLELENEYLRTEIRVAQGFGDIIGQSRCLKKVLTQVELVAPADTSVLIRGESGTGQELVARAIHERSRRRHRPMISVNCASIPRELFESEFFGHVKGAFTGAVRDRIGRFQLADGATLFLDEIGEIPLELQSKLLRVLQEGTFERIGEERTRTVDVRVIAATNRNLDEEAKAGRFREDLYYRLSVFPIEIAPLNQRSEDIAPLALHFLDEISRRLGMAKPKLKKRHVEALQRYSWPGNVRELQNVIERALILARSGPLEFDLPDSAGSTGKRVPREAATVDPSRILSYDELRNLERANVRAALEAARWRVSGPRGAAQLLGIKPTTLASKIKSLGLSPE